MIKVIKAARSGKSIKLLIHSKLAGVEPPRHHGTIHASDLMKGVEFCPREWAFLDMGLIEKKGEFIGTALRMTFDHGRDLENRIRNEYLRNEIVGNWKCGVCGHEHISYSKYPKIKCPTCGWGSKWEYMELRFEDPESGVSGGIDGMIDLSEGKLRLLELKSMDKDEHKSLQAPLVEHKFRTSLYLYLADKSNLPISDMVNKEEAFILYASKSYGFKDESMREAGISDMPFSPFKEFRIQRNDALVRDLVNKATALTMWRKNRETLPGLPCGICPNGLTKRAQGCKAVGKCFSGSFASSVTWIEKGVPKHPGKQLVAGS